MVDHIFIMSAMVKKGSEPSSIVNITVCCETIEQARQQSTERLELWIRQKDNAGYIIVCYPVGQMLDDEVFERLYKQYVESKRKHEQAKSDERPGR